MRKEFNLTEDQLKELNKCTPGDQCFFFWDALGRENNFDPFTVLHDKDRIHFSAEVRDELDNN